MVVLPDIVGIINITPDSLFAGSIHEGGSGIMRRVGEAIAHGAAVIDVGGESTRPDAAAVSPEEEWCRLGPFLGGIIDLAHESGVEVSLDTRNYANAAKAIELGIDYINDVSGLADPNMVALLRDFPHVKIIFGHSLSVPVKTDVRLPDNIDIVRLLVKWGSAKIGELVLLGIESSRLVFDPGLGFGKSRSHCWDIVKNAALFKTALGVKVMIGHSRKNFLAPDKTPAERDVETLALSLSEPLLSVDYIRVHDVLWHTRAFGIINHLGVPK